MNNIKFGMNIAKLRKVTGLTQKELAQKLNVTDKTVFRWERGVGFPDISTLCPLADALGVTVSKLLDAEDEDDEGKEQAFLQVSCYLAEKDLRYSKIKLKVVSVVLAVLLLVTSVFGYKYFRWHYEKTITYPSEGHYLFGSNIRFKIVDGYKLLNGGEYEGIGEVLIVVDIDECYNNR